MNTKNLTITKVINGGYGLGKLADGRMAMILHALPGETVTYSPLEKKKTYILGKVKKVEQPSPARITPPCQYYGFCGGCDLQHASYAEQLKIKTEIVQDLLMRQLPELDIKGTELVAPALASPEELHYRQRIRLWVNDSSQCGFRKHKSHEIVPIIDCLLARNEIRQVFSELQKNEHFTQLLNHTNEVELLWNPSTAKVTALLHIKRKPRPADFKHAQQICLSVQLLERLFFQGESFPLVPGAPSEGSRQMALSFSELNTSAPPFELSWEVGGFCQVNLRQNINLINQVIEMSAIQPNETVLDLFCGAGNFSIALAQMAKSVTGIEGQGSAIRSAKVNSLAANLTNTEFTKSPIHKGCENLVATGRSYDCLVVDPPRQGIPGLATQLHSLCSKRLVYISCDPATLCRDIADLVQTGFIVKLIQPVDMFPQTHHIETVALLEKN